MSEEGKHGASNFFSATLAGNAHKIHSLTHTHFALGQTPRKYPAIFIYHAYLIYAAPKYAYKRVAMRVYVRVNVGAYSRTCTGFVGVLTVYTKNGGRCWIRDSCKPLGIRILDSYPPDGACRILRANPRRLIPYISSSRWQYSCMCVY